MLVRRASEDVAILLRRSRQTLVRLPGEDVDGRRLSNLSCSVNDLLTTLVHGLNIDHHIAITHAGMGEFDGQLIVGKVHTNVISANQKTLYRLSPSNKAQKKNLRNNALKFALSDNSLDILAGT
jgi:hypothetical protein